MLGLEKFSRVNLLSGAATAALLLGSMGVAQATSATTNVNVYTAGNPAGLLAGFTSTGSKTQSIIQNNFNLPTPSTQGWSAAASGTASVSTTVAANGNGTWTLSTTSSGTVFASYNGTSLNGTPYYTLDYTNLTPEQVSVLANAFTQGASGGGVTVTPYANSLTVTILSGSSVTLPFNPTGSLGTVTQSQISSPLTTQYNFGTSAPFSGATSPLTIQAGITGAQVTNGNTTAAGTTTGLASSQNVSTNLISASAVGNTSTVNPTTSTAYSLTSLGGSAAGSSNGISAVVGQSNLGSGSTGGNVDVTAALATNTQSVTSSDLLAGSQTNITGNTMSASVTLNNSSTTLSGSIPVNYTAAGVPGNSTLTATAQPVSGSAFNFPPNHPPVGSTVAADGNIVATTDQLNAFTGVTSPASSVTGNTNLLSVSTNLGTGGVYGASGIQASQSGNSVGATYTGNAANTTISVAAGGAPTLSGSAVLTNVQENTLAATLTNAEASGNTISTAFTGTGANSVLASDSTINTTSNAISATATANQANGTAGAAGNVITLAPGVNLAGASTSPNNQSTIYSSQAVTADLALNSLQTSSVTPVEALAANNTVSQKANQASGSTLNLATNSISAAATSNNVSNAINAGTGGSGIITPTISGLIALQNSQIVDNLAPVAAYAQHNTIGLTAGSGPVAYTVANNTITSAGNSIGATATGANATNAVSVAADTVALGAGGAGVLGVESNTEGGNGVTGYPSASSSAGLSVNNIQYTAISNVLADNSNNAIWITATSTTGNLPGNLISLQGGSSPALQALAESNVASNSATVNATTLSGSVGVINTQSLVAFPVAGVQTGGTTATLSDSGLSITASSPGYSLTGNTIALGSGLTGTTPTGTGGNTLRALAYNNQGTNALNVTATTATLPGTNNTAVYVPFNVVLNPSMNAAYGSLSTQNASGASSASASFSSIPVMLTATNGTIGDTLSNASNVIAAAAYSNQQTNSASLTVTTLGQTSSTPAPMVSAATVQGTDTAGVTATITGPGTSALVLTGTTGWTAPSVLFGSNIDTGFGGGLNYNSLQNSTDAVSGNTAIAQAIVNSSNTTTSVAGGNIIDPGLISGLTSVFPQPVNANNWLVPSAQHLPTGTTAVAAVTAVTTQYANSAPVSASQSQTGAYTAVNGGVSGSTVLAQSNSFTASATNNVGTTGVTVGSATSPVTSLDASAGVVNAQYTDSGSTATATLGSAGHAAIPPYTGAAFDVYSPSPSVGLWTANSLAVSTNTVQLQFGSAADAAAFVGNIVSGSYNYTSGSTTVFVNPGTLTFSGSLANTIGWNFINPGVNYSQQGNFSIAGAPASPTYPAVQVLIAGNDITNSTLVTSANLATAAATGNSAANTLAVNATTLANGGVNGQAVAQALGEGDGATAVGTNTLLNQQMQYGAVNSTGFGLFTVTDIQANPTITGSTLTVANNGVSVSATGNSATSGATVSAGTVNGATAAISSNQGQWNSVYAQSGSGSGNTVTNYGMIVQAPVAVSHSTVAVTGNTNVVSATGNAASNTLSETGVNLLSAASAQQATTVNSDFGLYDGATQYAHADLLVTNAQTSKAPVSATATSLVANNDTGGVTSGLVSSTASLSHNATTASSVGNTTTNALDVSGTSLAQSLALSTSQDQRNFGVSGAVGTSTAYANQVVAFTLPGGLTGTTPAASQSTINLQANATTAQAQGNMATNAVKVTADTATFGATTDASVVQASASAAYALGNVQSSSEQVAATGVTNVSVADSLSYPAITNSTINVTGNTLNATGQASVANNSMTIASNSANGSTGVTGAVANYQTASAGVTADGTGTFSAPVRLDNSSVSISSNSTGSLASGNTATNALSVSTTDLTNVTGTSAVASSALNPNTSANSPTATGTFVVVNEQNGSGPNGSGPIAATTNSTVVNSDAAAGTTSGLVSSSAALNSNSATAASNVNVASNTLNLGALNNSATGAVSSYQTGSNTSDATVTQGVTFGLAGGVTAPAASNATIQANNNTASAAATVNSAANALNVSATAGASTAASGQAVASGSTLNGAVATSTGTDALANFQQALSNATASGTNTVTVADNGTYPAITGSAISVNGNSLVAGAQLNTATNTLTVAVADSTNAAGITGPYAVTSALTNSQVASGNSTANAGTYTLVGTPAVPTVGTIGQTLVATGRLDNSTMSLSNNLTQAQAIGNNASNSMGVTGTNVGANNTTLAATVTGTTNLTQAQVASATYAVQNTQTVSGAVGATAIASASNADKTATSTSGLNSSAVAINGNTTQALGFANNATNQLSLNATDLGATGAVGNSQISTSSVTSVAFGFAGYSLNGFSAPNLGTPNAAATGSTIAVNGNTTQAQAVGNAATNALNGTATAAYGSALPASNTSGTNSNTNEATATFAVLNNQGNTGAVSSYASTSASPSQYFVALNTNGSGSAVYGGSGAVNSSIGVTGNAVQAASYGNTATNSIALAALNSGNATAALTNHQVNTGNVTATASNALIGVSAVGSPGSFSGGVGLSGSSAMVSGNSISARAVGNSTISSITAH